LIIPLPEKKILANRGIPDFTRETFFKIFPAIPDDGLKVPYSDPIRLFQAVKP
jgi:hypothetical protein